MSLLTALNLPAPAASKNTGPAAPPTAATQPAKPVAGAAKPAAGAAKAGAAQPELAALDRSIAEAAQAWKTLADEEAKQELAQAVKDAQAQREAASKMGDATGRAAAVKKATDKLGEIKTKALDRARVAVGMKPGEKKPEEAKDGQFKPKLGVITDQGKLGLAGGTEAELEKKTKKGDVVTCTAAFEGKAWVDMKPVDYSEPPEIEATFHLVVGGKAGAGVKRETEGKGGASGKVSASVELELTFKRKLKPEETAGYLAAVKSANGGGWEELRALQLAAKGSMTEARALVAKLGGKERVAQEDDEVEQKLTSTVGAEGDASSKKGPFGISLSVGVSASGSLSRKVAFKDGQYWITLREASEQSAKGGAGFSVEGVGMSGSASKETHESRAVTFVIDPAKPADKPLLEQVLAATSVKAMLELRARNPGAASFDVKTKGDADGGGGNVSLFGVGVGGENRGFGSETEIDGPDGKTKIHEGGNTSGGHAIVGDKPVGGSTTTETFRGGAGADNKGFGESTSTSQSGDLLGGLGGVVDKLKKSPVTTAKNLAEGKEELSKSVVHVEGAAFSDESYGQLAERAKQGDGKWIKYWRGSMETLKDWRAIRGQIVAAGQNRQEIAKAVAAFERGSGRGRHDTVRNAIAGTEVAFELPPPLVPKKQYFDNLVVNDPLPAALAAKAPADVVKKLEDIDRQLTGFRNDMSKIQGEFGHLADFQDMAERIDARRIAVTAALKGANTKLKAAEDEKKGVNQFTPAGPNQSSMDSPEERDRIDKLKARIEQLKQSIGDAFQQEQKHFTVWEQNLQGDKALGFIPTGVDEKKLVEHEVQLRALYPKWDKMREELRKALGEAGKPYDPAEADAIQPDRLRYRALRKRDPQVGWQRPDGV